MSQDIKIKPMIKKVRGHQIQKLIRDIRIVERKRGTEKQIEKNKRRATRLQRKVEALRKIDLEHICSQFSGLTDPLSTDAVEQALSEAVKSGDSSKAPSQSAADQQPSGLSLSVGVKGLCDEQALSEAVKSGNSSKPPSQSTPDQQPSGNEFFITDDPVIATPLGANDVRHSNRHTVSHCSSERLSLNSLFLRSLGDQDGIAPLTKNRKGQRARQRMWELKYGKEAKHLRRTRRHTTGTKPKGQRSRLMTDDDSIHPSWKASKRLKEKGSIKQFKGTHVVFSDV